MKRLSANLSLCYLFWFVTFTKSVYFFITPSALTVNLTITVVLFIIAFIIFSIQLLNRSNFFWNHIDIYLKLYIIWIFSTIIFPDSESDIFSALGYASLFFITVVIALITFTYSVVNFWVIVNRSLLIFLIVRFSSLIIVILGFVVYGTNMSDRTGVISGLSPAVLGLSSSLGIIISLSFMKQAQRFMKFFDWLIIIICLTCLILSVSKGAIISLLLAVTATFVIFWRKRFYYIFIFSGLAIITTFLFENIIKDHLIDYLYPRNPWVDNINTLTGRTYFWSVIFDHYLNNIYRWIVGHGYHSFSDLFSPESGDLFFGIGQAHNAIIQIIFETGIVGFTLVMCCFGNTMKKIFVIWSYNKNNNEMTTLISILITIILFILIYGITEGSYGSTTSIVHYYMALVVVMTSVLHAERLRTDVQLLDDSRKAVLPSQRLCT